MTQLLPVQENWGQLTALNSSRYYGSTLGRVFSTRSNNILKGHKRSDGYIEVNITDDNGVKHKYLAHTVIATIFCVKLSEAHDSVDHWDGVRDNNVSSNLRWATRSE